MRKVDVRVIAATNRQLEREVNSGRFREDLYYRLSVLTVRVPPLRERMDDLQLLVQHFLAERDALDKAQPLHPRGHGEMKRYDWPGNVRELRNYVERKVVLEHHDRRARPRDALHAAPDAARTEPPRPAAPGVDLPFKEAKDAGDRRLRARLPDRAAPLGRAAT